MIFRIAFRNIFRQKRRTLLTMLTMIGGYILCSFSISFIDGTYNGVIDLFTRNQLGHIQIHDKEYLDRPSLYRSIDDYDSIGRSLETIDGVEAWTPRLYAAGLASVGNKTTGVRVVGIDPAREVVATRFDKKLIDGQMFSDEPSHEAMLGRGLDNRLGARPGDEVVIVSQGADGSIANDLYTIKGIVDSGNELADQTAIYLHLSDAQELLVLEGRVHELAVVSRSIRELESLAQRIVAAIERPRLSVETWQEFAKSFYDAMRADKQGTWVSLFIIVTLVAIGVLNTVLMSVLERTREYGLLRAVGTGRLQVFGLVVTEVQIMVVFSIVIGFVCSYILNYSLSFGGVPMPITVEYGGVEFSRYYTEINVRCFVIPLLSVIISAAFVSIFPAIRAARTQPAAAMRSH